MSVFDKSILACLQYWVFYPNNPTQIFLSKIPLNRRHAWCDCQVEIFEKYWQLMHHDPVQVSFEYLRFNIQHDWRMRQDYKLHFKCCKKKSVGAMCDHYCHISYKHLWHLSQLSPISAAQVPGSGEKYLRRCVRKYFSRCIITRQFVS